MSEGIVAWLKSPLPARADFSAVLADGWPGLGPDRLGRRRVTMDSAEVALAELFSIKGERSGRLKFEGDLSAVDRLGVGLTGGEVCVNGPIGDEVGVGMAGGVIEILGSTGSDPGGAAPEARRGMTGGELIIHGAAGERAGSRMRRGLIAIGGATAGFAGEGMIAGSLIVCGDAGPTPGLWSKRGSIVALGPVVIPPTYLYACTYQPDHLRLTLARLRDRYALPVTPEHLDGFYRRYCGDLADLGKGEILAWTRD